MVLETMNPVSYTHLDVYKRQFLNNRMKSKNLKLIFKLQGYQKFKRKYTDLSIAELLKAVWNYDIRICPECGCASMEQLARTYAKPS